MGFSATIAQTADAAHALTPDKDGVYAVAASELKRLPASPTGEFPGERSAYEIADKMTNALTITAEGKVKKAKAISGKSDTIKGAAEKSVKMDVPAVLGQWHCCSDTHADRSRFR